MSVRILKPSSIFDEEILLSRLKDLNVNFKAHKKLLRYIIQKNEVDIKKIPELPIKLLNLLQEEFTICSSKLLEVQESKDGSTSKLLIELQDGKKIESVIMRYGHVELDCFPQEELERNRDSEGRLNFKSRKRATLCVSSQVGCAMACTFCATGTMGLVANLTAGEIIEQLYHASKIENIRGIVFMGMGEPLDNYKEVLNAVSSMTDTSRFGLAPARISISTVGVVPRIISLKRDLPEIGLALSLHAPNQTLRQKIVPTTKAWPIEKILKACDEFIYNQNYNLKTSKRKRHVLIEYVLIHDVNDSVAVAEELGKLLAGKDVLLNVIPYNVTAVPYDYKPPTTLAQRNFVEVTRSFGVKTLLRQTMGSDINSACGQLVIEANNKGGCSDNIGDLEDIFANKKAAVSKSKEKQFSIKKNKVKSSVSGIKGDNSNTEKISHLFNFKDYIKSVLLMMIVLLFTLLSFRIYLKLKNNYSITTVYNKDEM
ncbi:sorting nexin [Clydaea vesicula]|uniref:Sorting nexin n=1 Tax=Clydaea vesicula TaxID=447962 RepID=A0AAD5U7P2_9FUNG|nr:sorting nexin [Clydaea vesicula]KAJ3387365.1 sorting nexin [Lobulomyces angularis]